MVVLPREGRSSVNAQNGTPLRFEPRMLLTRCKTGGRWGKFPRMKGCNPRIGLASSSRLATWSARLGKTVGRVNPGILWLENEVLQQVINSTESEKLGGESFHDHVYG
jgi:hypothetical protein